MSKGNAKYLGHALKKKKRVYFVGTASTKYDEGIGLCYNRDYGTATAKDESRDNRVEVPSRSNNMAFAGVLASSVTLDSTGEGWVDIYEPGSVCNIAIYQNTVIDTGRITCLAAGGDNTSMFGQEGFKGRGSAIPMETVTAVLEDDLTGTAAISAAGTALTVADSSDFVVGTDGSKLLILGGEDDGTGAVQPGLYTITTLTSGTEIAIPTVMDATADAAGTLSFVVIDRANATCLAYLEDGEESGLVEWISPPNAGSGGMTHMVGGKTYVNGGVTLTADADVDLAQGPDFFHKKCFYVMGTLADFVFTIDLVTNGIQLDGSTALTEVLTMDAAGDAWVGEFVRYRWFTRDFTGGTTEG